MYIIARNRIRKDGKAVYIVSDKDIKNAPLPILTHKDAARFVKKENERLHKEQHEIYKYQRWTIRGNYVALEGRTKQHIFKIGNEGKNNQRLPVITMKQAELYIAENHKLNRIERNTEKAPVVQKNKAKSENQLLDRITRTANIYIAEHSRKVVKVVRRDSRTLVLKHG